VSKLRIIGDVHGKRPDYLKLVNKANAEGLYTLQLGDLGFAYEYRRLLDGSFNVEMNKFFGGNHDGYNLLSKFQGGEKIPLLDQFCLGDYGLAEINGVSLFFVRGAFSIDKKYRHIGVDWFYEEEIAASEHQNILDAYKEAKPDLVVTHDCPDSIGKSFAKAEDGNAIGSPLKKPDILREFGFDPNTFSTRTQVLLENMFRIHQPKKWVFGHYHRDWTTFEEGTEFRCLNELHFTDV